MMLAFALHCGFVRRKRAFDVLHLTKLIFSDTLVLRFTPLGEIIDIWILVIGNFDKPIFCFVFAAIEAVAWLPSL